jgi:hypothetical protein
MIPSLAGIPIVGYISADEAGDVDFGGHGQKIVIDDNGIRLEYVGRAYGCVLENNNAKFETKLCSDGVEREFLTCEAVLWKKFDECINILERDGAKGQSMELYPGSIKGYFDADGIFHFTDAKFEALCILGDKHIPAMTGSVIEHFDVNSIQQQLKEMLTELSNSIKRFTVSNFIAKDEIGTGDPIEIDNSKDSANMTGSWGEVRDGKLIVHKGGCQAALAYLNANDPNNTKAKAHLKRHYRELGLDTSNFDVPDVEGGNEVDDKLELLEKYGLTVEQLDFSIDDLTVEELEEKLKEFVTNQATDDVDNPVIDFALTNRQLVEELQRELAKETYVDEYGYEWKRYYYLDNDDTRVWAEDSADSWKIYSFTYSVSGDRVTIDFESKKRAKIVYVDFDDGDTDTTSTVMSVQRAEDRIAHIKRELEDKFEADKAKAVSEVENQLNDIRQKYESSLEHIKELEAFKNDVLRKQRQEAEEALFAQYKQLEGVEEYEALKEKAHEFSLEDLEKELALLYVKKVASFSLSSQKDDADKIGVDNAQYQDDEKPYGDLFERYGRRTRRRR